MELSGNRAEKVVGILLAVAFAFLASTSVAHASGEFEPNESRGTAAGPVAPGATVNATIEVHDDSDWFKFYVADPGTVVKFTATKTNGVETPWSVEFVEDIHGDYEAAHHFDPTETSHELSGSVGPGKYYAWVAGSSQVDSSGLTYSLTFTQGLSTFQAIMSGCNTSKGNVTTRTAAVKSASASLTAATAAVNRALGTLGNANKALSKAKKKKAKTAKARRAKKKAISKAKKSVSKSKSAVADLKADAIAAQLKLNSAELALQKAQEDSDRLCAIEA